MLPVLICHLMFVHTLPCKDNANHTQNIKFYLNIMPEIFLFVQKIATNPKANTAIHFTAHFPLPPHFFNHVEPSFLPFFALCRVAKASLQKLLIISL